MMGGHVKKRKRIILVNPNNLWNPEEGAYSSKNIIELRKIVPPLGLAYIAGYIREFCDVKIIDANALNYSFKETLNLVFEQEPDVVGVTSFYVTSSTVSQFGDELRKKGILAVVGGADPSASPERYVNHFDFVALGEAEETFKEIIEGKESGTIRGVCFLKAGKIINTGQRECILNLNSIPFPAWDLLPIKQYRPETMNVEYKTPMAMISTSRGCCYNCDFCASNVVFKKLRFRSPENVFSEIKLLHNKFGIKYIIFIDDTFTANRKNTLELCNLIIKSEIKIKWSCCTTADNVDRELLGKMKKAGCHYVLFGVQSVHKNTLKKINRPLFNNTIAGAVALAKQQGLMVRLDFIFGLPGEDVSAMRDSIKFSIKLNPDIVSFYPLLILPGSRLYESNYTPSPSNKVLNDITREAYQKFYLRSGYILSRFKYILHPKAMLRYFKCAFAYLLSR